VFIKEMVKAHLALSRAATLPCRHRGYHCIPEEELRLGSLRLALLRIIPRVRQGAQTPDPVRVDDDEHAVVTPQWRQHGLGATTRRRATGSDDCPTVRPMVNGNRGQGTERSERLPRPPRAARRRRATHRRRSTRDRAARSLPHSRSLRIRLCYPTVSSMRVPPRT
jgi:hypothetical protein